MIINLKAQLQQPIDEMVDLTSEQAWKHRSRFPQPKALISSPSTPSPTSFDSIIEIAISPSSPPMNVSYIQGFNILLDNLESVVILQCETRLNMTEIDDWEERDEWNFMGSVFFSMTVFTTIGKWNIYIIYVN